MEVILDPNYFIGREYNKDTFHCYTFLEECLNVPRLKDVAVDTAKNDIERYKNLFTEIETAINYCIIVLGDTHIGIMYGNGAYHCDRMGVRWESLRSLKLKYKKVEYFDIC